MRRLLEIAVAVVAVIVITPIYALAALFYDDDPADSYKMQNW